MENRTNRAMHFHPLANEDMKLLDLELSVLRARGHLMS